MPEPTTVEMPMTPTVQAVVGRRSRRMRIVLTVLLIPLGLDTE